MEIKNQYEMTGSYDLRFMAGTFILMPVGVALTDSRIVPLVVNEVTAFILTQLQQKPLTEGELLALLLKEYSVEKQEAEEALASVLEQMIDKAVLKKVFP